MQLRIKNVTLPSGKQVRIVSVLSVMLLAVALPLVLTQVQQQQQSEQHADFQPTPSTIVPTVSQSTVLSVQVYISGNKGSVTPLRRGITISMYDQNNVLQYTQPNGIATYDAQAGSYRADISMEQVITPGTYLVSITSPGFHAIRQPMITVTPGNQPQSVPAISLTPDE